MSKVVAAVLVTIGTAGQNPVDFRIQELMAQPSKVAHIQALLAL